MPALQDTTQLAAQVNSIYVTMLKGLTQAIPDFAAFAASGIQFFGSYVVDAGINENKTTIATGSTEAMNALYQKLCQKGIPGIRIATKELKDSYPDTRFSGDNAILARAVDYQAVQDTARELQYELARKLDELRDEEKEREKEDEIPDEEEQESSDTEEEKAEEEKEKKEEESAGDAGEDAKAKQKKKKAQKKKERLEKFREEDLEQAAQLAADTEAARNAVEALGRERRELEQRRNEEASSRQETESAREESRKDYESKGGPEPYDHNGHTPGSPENESQDYSHHQEENAYTPDSGQGNHEGDHDTRYGGWDTGEQRLDGRVDIPDRNSRTEERQETGNTDAAAGTESAGKGVPASQESPRTQEPDAYQEAVRENEQHREEAEKRLKEAENAQRGFQSRTHIKDHDIDSYRTKQRQLERAVEYSQQTAMAEEAFRMAKEASDAYQAGFGQQTEAGKNQETQQEKSTRFGNVRAEGRVDGREKVETERTVDGREKVETGQTTAGQYDPETAKRLSSAASEAEKQFSMAENRQRKYQDAHRISGEDLLSYSHRHVGAVENGQKLDLYIPEERPRKGGVLGTSADIPLRPVPAADCQGTSIMHDANQTQAGDLARYEAQHRKLPDQQTADIKRERLQEMIQVQVAEKTGKRTRVNVTDMQTRFGRKLVGLKHRRNIGAGFRSIPNLAGRIVLMSSMENPDTAAGRSAQSMLNYASPVGLYLISKMNGVRISAIRMAEVDGALMRDIHSAFVNAELLGAESQFTNSLGGLMSMLKAIGTGPKANERFERWLLALKANHTISEELYDAMAKHGPELLRSPDKLKALMKLANGRDRMFLNALVGQADLNITHGISFGMLIGTLSRQAGRSLINAAPSPGLNALLSTERMMRYIWSTARLGGRLMYNIGRITGVGKWFAARTPEPIKFTAKQTQKVLHPVRTITHHRFRIGGLERRSLAEAVSRTTEKITVRVKETVIVRAFRKLAGTKIGAAVRVVSNVLGTVFWVLKIVIIVLLILMFIEFFFFTKSGSTEQDSTTKGKSIVTGMQIQNTDLVQEIITDLNEKNEAFNAQINRAQNERSLYTGENSAFATNDSGIYENYEVKFVVDVYKEDGTVTSVVVDDPSHFDLDNTKAIIAMASRYCQYNFQKLPDNASEEDKKTEAQLEEYFKSYCETLWAATHKIQVEELYNVDGTDQNTGACQYDGTVIWLPENFKPNVVSRITDVHPTAKEDHECDTCKEEYDKWAALPHVEGKALCTHPQTGYDDGWEMTGETRQELNCKGHPYHHHDEDGDPEDCGVDYCTDVETAKSGCTHTVYKWVYHCGKHVGASLTVRVGNLSRMTSFGAANDVDYSAVGKYDGDNDESESAAGSESAAEPETSQSAENTTP